MNNSTGCGCEPLCPFCGAQLNLDVEQVYAQWMCGTKRPLFEEENYERGWRCYEAEIEAKNGHIASLEYGLQNAARWCMGGAGLSDSGGDYCPADMTPGLPWPQCQTLCRGGERADIVQVIQCWIEWFRTEGT